MLKHRLRPVWKRSWVRELQSYSLSIFQSLNPFLSLRDRDRADTILTFHQALLISTQKVQG